MDFGKLEQLLEEIIALGVPGVDCIVTKGYETVFRNWSGMADREQKIPMQGKELFNLYSATKLITCIAVMQLYEKGKILLDDLLEEYLPEFKNMQIIRINMVGEKVLLPAKNKITIENLLTMTAGFDYNLKSQAILEVQSRTYGKAPTSEIIYALSNQPIHYEPGTRWAYSLAHDVLGRLVEVVSKERFGAYLHKHIFEPLGMNRTSFERTEEIENQMMAQYKYNSELNTIDRISKKNEFVFGSEYESGGAGLVSCVDDYVLLTMALANGGVGKNGAQILNQDTIDLMRMNHLTKAQMDDFKYPQLVGYGYGLGVRTMVDKITGGSIGSIGEFGWAGAAGVYVLIDVEKKVSMFYTQHVLECMEPYIHRRLRNVMYACL